MSVNFYHGKRAYSSKHCDWVDDKTGSSGFSYMMFHFVRCRLWSFFNPTAGCVWLNWPLGDNEGKCFAPDMRKFVLDIATWCPKDCWPMFVQFDCEGKLSSSQCRKIMKRISQFDIDSDIDQVSVEKNDFFQGKLVVDNSIVNDGRTKHLTKYYVGGMRHAAESGLSFFWC